MLLTYRQYQLLMRTFPRGSAIRVGSIPDASRRSASPGWNDSMNAYANRNALVSKITLIDTPYTADGHMMYDVQLRLNMGEKSYDFTLDWIDDPRLNDMFNSKPLNVSKINTTPNKIKPKELGIGMATLGAITTALGLAYIKNRKTQKKVQDLILNPADAAIQVPDYATNFVI